MDPLPTVRTTKTMPASPSRRTGAPAREHALSRRDRVTRRAADRAFEQLETRTCFTAGALDPTFGNAGLVLADFAARDDAAYSVVVQPDGKIVVAGCTMTDAGTKDFAVARFNVDGSADATFGAAGLVTIDFNTTGVASTDDARAVAVDSLGRILVAGTATRGTNSDFALVRLSPNGSIDTTFGTAGRVVSDLTGKVDQAFGMVVQPDGKIAVAGAVDNDFGVARYTDSGALDTPFGINGLARTGFGSTDAATGLVLQPDGKLVAGGYARAGAGFDFAAVRYNADGSMDQTFGAGGKVVTDLGLSAEQANAIAVGPGGTIVLAGRTGGDFAVVRYTAAGAPDPSFGGGTGIAIVDFDSADTASAVTVADDGSILLAGGTLGGSSPRNFALLRLLPTGDLDPTFEGGGVTTTDFQGSLDEAFAMTVHDGKLVVVGRSTPDNFAPDTFDFAVARYLLADAPPTGNPTDPPPPANVAPTANANGPYALTEGASVTLASTGSTDADGSIVSYEWDFDYADGAFNVDATGDAPTFSAAALDGPLTRTIALRVTDNAGASTIVTTTVTVNNAAPVVTLANPGAGVRQFATTFSADFSDAGALDTHTVTWNFGDGSPVVTTTGTSPDARVVQHAYTTTGKFTVTITVTDDEGASATATQAVEISAVALRPSATAPGKADLLVGGTNGNDLILFVSAGKRGVGLLLNNKILGPFAVTGRIIAMGGDGNDLIAAPCISTPVTFYGGRGNDLLIGGGGDDSLFGGDGNDILHGLRGNDYLEGNAGNDVLFGGNDDDRFVGGAGRDEIHARRTTDILDDDPSDDVYPRKKAAPSRGPELKSAPSHHDKRR
jgi:uncharacterized delta-60 repeat protein